ncbi:DUF4158 domain-containing protein [Parasphingorhabdus pacifica]
MERFFCFDDADRVPVGRHRGERNRLGFSLQLATVRYLGRSWRIRWRCPLRWWTLEGWRRSVSDRTLRGIVAVHGFGDQYSTGAR